MRSQGNESDAPRSTRAGLESPIEAGGGRAARAELDPDRRLTVGFITPAWPPQGFANGVITSVAHTASELRRMGHRALILPQGMAGAEDDVWPIDREVDDRPKALRAYHRILDRISSRDGYARVVSRKIASLTRRLVDERGLQVLEMEEAFGWPSLVRGSVPIPIIVRLHGPWFLNGPLQDGFFEGSAFQERVRAEKEGIRSADWLTAPSLDVLERTRAFYQLPLENALVIPNPAPRIPAEARWRREGADPDLVLFVGRFDRHKGGDLIIEAFARVVQRRPSARLLFAGDDRGFTDEEGRRRQVAEFIREKLPNAAEADRVEWVGRQPPDVLAGYRRMAGVTVCCSRYETFGYTAIEALAFGSPLVAAGAGAMLELVEDGVNGLICRSGESEDLAEKICRLQSDGDLAEKIGRRAALDCETKYDPSRFAEEMAKAYNQALARRSALGRG